MPTPPFHVVVAGGGVAGLESLLALRGLAGDHVSLTLVSPGDRFRLRALAVAEPFALGHAQEVAYAAVADDLDVSVVAATAVAVDDHARELRTIDGSAIGYDALLLAPGATTTAGLDHAMTWTPEAAPEIFAGLLRDMDEGYLERLAFVVPDGPSWPLPAFELALMTAREATAMCVEVEVVVVTPHADPLEVFGLGAGGALRAALEDAGVHLVTGVVAHVDRRPVLNLAPGTAGTARPVDRVVAMPALRGPSLEGIACDDHGFILAGPHGLVRDCTRTWAAGDGVASPLKMGGLASHQADRAAYDIALAAGFDLPLDHEADALVLDAVLMTGVTPVALDDRPLVAAAGTPSWWPGRKVAGRYLESYLAARA